MLWYFLLRLSNINSSRMRRLLCLMKLWKLSTVKSVLKYYDCQIKIFLTI